jgi:type IV secretory pathway VirB3-like protein
VLRLVVAVVPGPGLDLVLAVVVVGVVVVVVGVVVVGVVVVGVFVVSEFGVKFEPEIVRSLADASPVVLLAS